MALTPAKSVPHNARTTLIKVVSYDEDKNIKGVLHNAALENGIPFASLTQMLFGIEKILDDFSFPQNEMHIRSFERKRFTQAKTVAPPGSPEECVASFVIKVVFRQNASWQGVLTWVEEESEASFRSVFELISLLDGALSESKMQ